MSEAIKLKVPDEVPAGFVSAEDLTDEETRPVWPEYISQGNHAIDVNLGEEVEVKNPRFADWLVREYGFEDLTPSVDDSEYPKDFPRREVFIDLGLPIDQIRGMDRDALLALNGVGEKTADAVVEYFAKEKK